MSCDFSTWYAYHIHLHEHIEQVPSTTSPHYQCQRLALTHPPPTRPHPHPHSITITSYTHPVPLPLVSPHQGPPVLWLPVNDLHILNPSLGNVHWHGGNCGDEPADHTGGEVTLDVVFKVIWGGGKRGGLGERRRGEG